MTLSWHTWVRRRRKSKHEVRRPAQRFVATIRIRTYADDDGVGAVIGYDSPKQHYRLIWLGNGRRILRRESDKPHEFTYALGPQGAWEPYHTYRVELDHDPVAGTIAARIVDLDTGALVWDTGLQHDPDVLPPGRAGFMSGSQRYGSFRAWLPHDGTDSP